ncbi:hypothetical protein SCYZ1_15 [Pseudomonas phage SCYZ1]|nr:hypothetical protein SCYZ1_15 [Pseudomonas phage SCYZ1]
MREQVVMVLETDATRKYPFSRHTLDQIQDLRHHAEKELNDANPNKSYMVPAPVILAQAIDDLHAKVFP